MRRLETERLVLRAPEAADAAVIAAMWADPAVTQYLGRPRDYEQVRGTLEDEARDQSRDAIGFWPVIDKASGRVNGDCGLTRKDIDGREEIDVVYVFVAASWGQGYATEAASALRDYAFGELGLSRLIALLDPENTASARVAQKLGMEFEREVMRSGTTRKHVYAMPASPS